MTVQEVKNVIKAEIHDKNNTLQAFKEELSDEIKDSLKAKIEMAYSLLFLIEKYENAT